MSFDKPWGNYLLEGIVETAAPQNISFWPQTVAWQLIFLLLFLYSLKKIYQHWKRYQNNAYRREALTWLANCSLTNEEDIRQLPTLLRKTALLANDISRQYQSKPLGFDTATNRRYEITKLTGISWAQWLDKHCPKSRFSQTTLKLPKGHQSGESIENSLLSCANLLAQLAYRTKIDTNDSQLTNAIRHLCQQIELWIKYHELNEEPNKGNALCSTGEQT